MKKILTNFFFLLSVFIFFLSTLFLASIVFAAEVDSQNTSEEAWKGPANETHSYVGLLAGFGMMKNSLVMPTRVLYGYKVLNRGFVPDINNQVHLEAAMGPVFLLDSDETAWSGSVGARWSFFYSPSVVYYALGGLKLQFINDKLKKTAPDWLNTISVSPSLGIGAAYEAARNFWLRAEYGYDLFSLGFFVAF